MHSRQHPHNHEEHEPIREPGRSDGCACDVGHGHGHADARAGCACAEARPASPVPDITGLLLLGGALVFSGWIAAPWVAAAGLLLLGYPLFYAGIKALATSFAFDELTLMTIAVLASMALAITSEQPLEPLFEAAAVTVLFRLGAWLEDKAVDKSRRDIEALTEIRPDTATLLLDDGTRQVVPAQTVAVGSRIVLLPGERIALDCAVESGAGYVDFSAITGEPLPQSADAGTALLSGAVNLDGLLVCRTTASFENSAASRIIRIVRESQAQKGQAERLISRFAKIYTPAVVAAAAVVALVPPLLNLGPYSVWIPRALIFLVASCPCALVISVPLTFFAGAGAASRVGVLIKGTRHLETLSRADCVVFDKTGTLTRGVPTVGTFIAAEGFDPAELLALAAAAEQNSTHPAARAVAAYAGEPGDLPVTDFAEHSGRGVSATIGGRNILCGSARLLTESGVELGSLPEDGILLAVDGRAAAAFVLTDLPRPQAKEALDALRALGVRHLAMLTGDSRRAADQIANELGLDWAGARMLPQDKVAEVARLRQRYRATLFVGDGINDAPVLASADAGVAMGMGTDAAIEAADIVLMHERLAALPDAIAVARRTVRKARENILFALGVKAVVLALGVIGMATMWMAVFADTGVTLLTILNSLMLMRKKS